VVLLICITLGLRATAGWTEIVARNLPSAHRPVPWPTSPESGWIVGDNELYYIVWLSEGKTVMFVMLA
jgi:hypothetical protein